MVILDIMKRVASRRSHAKRDSGVDEGQIIEALRLTPTERWEKHRVFVDLIEEIERAARLRPRDPHPRRP
jgi:hypothetical protein